MMHVLLILMAFLHVQLVIVTFPVHMVEVPFAIRTPDSVPVDMALEESDAISVLLDIITFLTVSGVDVIR